MLKNICAPAQHFFQKPNFAPFRLCVELLFSLFFLPPSVSLPFSVCSTSVSLPIFTPGSHFFLHFICCVFVLFFFFFVPLSRAKHVSAAAVAIRFVSYLPPFFCLPEKLNICFQNCLHSVPVCVCVCVLINWFRFGS